MGIPSFPCAQFCTLAEVASISDQKRRDWILLPSLVPSPATQQQVTGKIALLGKAMDMFTQSLVLPAGVLYGKMHSSEKGWLRILAAGVPIWDFQCYMQGWTADVRLASVIHRCTFAVCKPRATSATVLIQMNLRNFCHSALDDANCFLLIQYYTRGGFCVEQEFTLSTHIQRKQSLWECA